MLPYSCSILDTLNCYFLTCLPLYNIKILLRTKNYRTKVRILHVVTKNYLPWHTWEREGSEGEEKEKVLGFGLRIWSNLVSPSKKIEGIWSNLISLCN